MKTEISLLLLSLLLANSSVFAQTGEFLDASFPFADTTTSYQLYVPEAYSGAEPWPLIINLHGFGSGPGIQAFTSQMNEAADTAHYLVAYPNGKLTIGPDGTERTGWNADWWMGRDDLNALSTLIDHVWSNYRVDLSRVYAIGLDNGGQMALAMGCALDDRIAAVGGVAIPFTLPQAENCMPGRPIPNLFMHGTADVLTPFSGFPGLVLGAPELAQEWASQNGCFASPQETPLPDINTEDSSTVTLKVYEQCSEDAEVRFYEIEGGGHTWSDGPPVPPGFEILGNVNRDVNTSGEMLAFFERFSNPDPREGTFIEDAGTDNVLDASIFVDGVERTYSLYIPPTYDGVEEWPLVVALHGFATRSRFQITISEILPVADTEEFIVVAPQGLIREALDDTGEGWNIELRDDLADDVGFIDQLLDDLVLTYAIDQGRVYMTGFSQGGVMTYQLANLLSDRIAAIAPVSAALPDPSAVPIDPPRPMPMIQVHGTDDGLAVYDEATERYIPFLSVPTTLETWLALNGCSTDAVMTELPDIIQEDESTVTQFEYTGCIPGAEVVHLRVNEGGHTWPGSITAGLFSGTTNQDINASQEIWNFVSQYRLPEPTDQDGFSLVDASLDAPVAAYTPLVSGAVLDLSLIPQEVNIVASFSSNEIAKVEFTLNGAPVRTEQVVPYALFGDVSSDFAPGRLPVGEHVLNALALAANGDELQALSVSFKVIDGNTPAVLNMVLVDAEADRDLFTLSDTQQLNLDELPLELNIRAEVNDLVKSVSFDLNEGRYERLETVPPFALFGDLSGDYLSGTFVDGSNTIKVTPYTGTNGTGMAGETQTWTLNVMGSHAGKSSGMRGSFVESKDELSTSFDVPACIVSVECQLPQPV